MTFILFILIATALVMRVVKMMGGLATVNQQRVGDSIEMVCFIMAVTMLLMIVSAIPVK